MTRTTTVGRQNADIIRTLSELVVFAAGNVTLIDVILHVDEKVRVSVIKKGYSTRCNVTTIAILPKITS
jgi:hypothetical protein